MIKQTLAATALTLALGAVGAAPAAAEGDAPCTDDIQYLAGVLRDPVPTDVNQPLNQDCEASTPVSRLVDGIPVIG